MFKKIWSWSKRNWIFLLFSMFGIIGIRCAVLTKNVLAGILGGYLIGFGFESIFWRMARDGRNEILKIWLSSKGEKYD